MLKQLLGIILLTAALNPAIANQDVYSVAECKETQVRINEVPFPRSSQIGVSWEKVFGNWATEEYIFELGNVVTRENKRFISVRMIDPLTGEAIKKGGVAIRADGMRASGIITALKSVGPNKKTDDTFVIFRAFKEQDATGRPTNRDLFVITIRTLREKVKVCDETHHALTKQDTSEAN